MGVRIGVELVRYIHIPRKYYNFVEYFRTSHIFNFRWGNLKINDVIQSSLAITSQRSYFVICENIAFHHHHFFYIFRCLFVYSSDLCVSSSPINV